MNLFRHPCPEPGSHFFFSSSKKRWIPAFAGMTMILGSAAPAQAPATPAAPDYSKDSVWLCLPDRADVCSTPVATTELGPSGYGTSGKSAVAKDPPIDCFYVYPTVSSDKGLNSDLNVDEEKG